MANWELCNAIRQSSMKRIVEDGNLIQQLISKIDLQISTDQKSEAVETLSLAANNLTLPAFVNLAPVNV